ncbi:MAG TPA: GGDEF domain-containing protein [Terracidiphilus sp.]|nr:GGDEF domain-containing protein [Terracidiphilus sp.]
MGQLKVVQKVGAGLIPLLLLLEIAGFLAVRNSVARDNYVDAANIATAGFAVLACLYAAALAGGRIRAFWLLVGSALALHLSGDLGWAYCHAFHVPVVANSLLPSIFFRLYALPVALALFLSDDIRPRRLEDFLDGAIVVALVLVTMYQIQSAETSAGDPHLWRVVSAGTAINFVLICGAIGRSLFSSRPATRALFMRLAVYLIVYGGVALFMSLDDVYFKQLDKIDDLFWTLSYLTGAAVAITWRPGGAESETADLRISRRASLLCFNLTLAAMVLGGTVIGLRSIHPMQMVSLGGVSVVLLSFAIRSALMQDRQERYLAALRASQQQLQRQAHYDELTELPNRRMFYEQLERALALAKREGWQAAVLYLDLDGFKPVNDRYGHAVGDELMAQAAKRMQGRVRKSDTLARMGGDEFTLVVAHLNTCEDAGRLASELQGLLNEPFMVDGHPIVISASIGVAVFPKDSMQPEELVERADQAMYRAKRSGPGTMAYWAAHETGLPA